MKDSPVPELLRQASVILAQEVGRTPSRLLDGALPELVQRLGVTGAPEPPAPLGTVMPSNTASAKPADPRSVVSNSVVSNSVVSNSLVPSSAISSTLGQLTGAGVPNARAPGAPGDLQKQAHELLAMVLSLVSPQKGALPGLPGGAGGPSLEPNVPFYPVAGGGQRCPISGAELPTFPGARDQLRRKAHELIETLLVTFNEATGEKGLPTENQVPLVNIPAPVAPGETGRLTLTVANEESTPADVSLYSTNFVADHGHELPSLRVTILPRVALIPAQGQATFEVSIAVPQQTLKGSYCGLIQAHGSRYFKAVLALDVL